MAIVSASLSKQTSPGRPFAAPPFAAISFVAAIAVLIIGLRPSPRFSLDSHWLHFGLCLLPAAALLVVSLILAGRRFRLLVLSASIILISVAALLHPVCVPIPESDRPSFEAVRTLQQRAADGEPFCNLDGQWYQCKSFLARSLFF